MTVLDRIRGNGRVPFRRESTPASPAAWRVDDDRPARASADLRARDRGRGALRRRLPRDVRDRRVELPPAADRRRRSRGRSTTSSRRTASATGTARRCCRAAAARASPARPSTTRWSIDFTKYLHDFDDPDLETQDGRLPAGRDQREGERAHRQVGSRLRARPSTHSYCSIGGNIGNNSCGIHSVQAQFYGHGPRTSDNVHSLEIVTYDGVRMWVGETSPRRATRRSSPPAGGAAQIYRDLNDLVRRYEPLIRERFPSAVRAAAARLRLQPRRAAARERLQPRARDRRHRGHGARRRCRRGST